MAGQQLLSKIPSLTEARFRVLDLLLKLIAATALVIGAIWTVYIYRDTAATNRLVRQESIERTSESEAFGKQSEVITGMFVLAADVANEPDATKKQDFLRQFQRMYGSFKYLVSNPTALASMKELAEAVDKGAADAIKKQIDAAAPTVHKAIDSEIKEKAFKAGVSIVRRP